MHQCGFFYSCNCGFFVNCGVKERRSIHLDFEVDKLTNSIENVLTKDVFATDVFPVSKEDLKNVTKKSGWVFDWKKEFTQQSFRYGYEGNVSFLSKTQLIDHCAQSLGAIHIGGHRMIIETRAALKLINRYFKN